MGINTCIRECDFAIHWNSEKGYGMGATDMHVSCTSVYKHEMTCCGDIVPVSGPTVSCLAKFGSFCPQGIHGHKQLGQGSPDCTYLSAPFFLLEKMSSFPQFRFFMHN